MGPEDKARVVSVSEPDSRRFGVRSAPVRWSASLIERASLVPAAESTCGGGSSEAG